MLSVHLVVPMLKTMQWIGDDLEDQDDFADGWPYGIFYFELLFRENCALSSSLFLNTLTGWDRIAGG